jgi:hypothetical protein
MKIETITVTVETTTDADRRFSDADMENVGDAIAGLRLEDRIEALVAEALRREARLPVEAVDVTVETSA